MKTTHNLRHAGRSLIEVMVAMVIGSIVLTGVLLVASGTSNSGRRVDAMGQMTENGQVALQIMADNVRMSGFSVPIYFATPGYESKQYMTAGVVGCDSNFTNTSGGGAAASLAALNCNNDEDESSAIAVTYQVDDFNAMLVASDDNLRNVAPADCRGFGLVTNPGSTLLDGNEISATQERNENGTPAELNANTYFWRVENRYFIGPDTDGTPSLRCSGNGGTQPFNSSQTLIRGVERMVITYGIAQGGVQQDASDNVLVLTGGTVNYLTAAEMNATWPAEAPAVRWQRVVSARICLELLGEPGSADAGTAEDPVSYTDCDGDTVNIEDGRMRRAVTQLVNLRNRTALPQGGTLGVGDI